MAYTDCHRGLVVLFFGQSVENEYVRYYILLSKTSVICEKYIKIDIKIERGFNIYIIIFVKEVPTDSHPWAPLTSCIQSHTSVCSFQQETKYTPRLLPLRPRNFKERALTIAQIISLLEKHFNYKYSGHGASRLPTIAVYAAYQCMMGKVARYEDKILCDLESYTSSDVQSGQIGEIQVNNSDGTPFEDVEIKHKIVVSPDLDKHAFSKLMLHRTDRYYIFTTANMDSANWDEINTGIDLIDR